MAHKIEISFDAKNIGVHTDLKSGTLELDSAKFLIYATNGTGKTCLSRAFNLYAKANRGEEVAGLVRRVLNFDSDTADFDFKVRNVGVSQDFGFAIQIKADADPVISRTSKYLFHVFNRDYVIENVEPHNFSPNADIEGIILGKENIDVSKEEVQLANLKIEADRYWSLLEESVSESKDELRNLGIRQSVAEFKQVTVQNVITTNPAEPPPKDFNVLTAELERVIGMPDDLPDATNFDYAAPDGLLEKVDDLLSTSYSRNSLAESFKAKISSKLDFIISGLKISDGNSCPFCEQKYEATSLALIDEYNSYLEDEEAKITASLREASTALNGLRMACNSMYQKFLESKISADKIKQFLPTAIEDLVEVQNSAGLDHAFQLLSQKIETKICDISVSLDADAESRSQIALFLQKTREAHDANERLLRALNLKKRNVASATLQVRKDLCLAKVEVLRKKLNTTIEAYKINQGKIASLEADVKTKLHKIKKDKKQEVIRTLKEILSRVFGEKYSFDEEKFCLKLKERRLAGKAADVLSDGEKSIIAFCHYIATTHCIVDNDDDYRNLFFIVDDPISSLDLHFVYAVNQCIKDLNRIFPQIDDRLRFLILTHNLDFVSILDRNLTCQNVYRLRGSNVSRFKSSLLLPYQGHLQDIWDVHSGVEEPGHTTPNSIRHVLEAIQKWMSPNEGLDKFFQNSENLRSNAHLWTLMQDQSHGTLLTQPPTSPELVKNACGSVIEFIKNSNLTGQLEGLDDASSKAS